ncbi:phage antirepressor protein [Candidatus Nomurabacteria bacterium RIFCSPHIGHO2_02_FULL_37_13]|uniref:Phage antirepressor protein n=1 Tax=Candidatus Nomurabacteria bacterium RIFCSPHIGHO2_02_FULL_37_13 TaxID=1801750 RepID=A0A1F6W6E9_9BACT|nr:MAG: phage antirepressor protein [Candidatus Nomurabacteria bacterium RIFCSPHIGHO2_02_FULL_37_13]OGI88297.1 MAG: phage antirepressor protein [Candidatus Nomurabacteria bacterium RIFCSPLOWO2_01_FULL_37_25]
MVGTKENKNNHIALFEGNKVRRVWHDEKWFFVVEDVVLALIDSKNVKDYINKIRQRDPELSKGYGQIVHTLDVPTKGGIQSMNCADLEGIFRIIQSIPSPKAEPFKQWLAKVGKERVDEIQNPELAMERMKSLYEQKGLPADWIAKRMRGIAVRNTLTDEWNKRGLKKGVEYAILTNEIMQGTFDMKVDDYKKHKNLSIQHNLRDHMGDIELILTMLAEATTTKLSVDRDSLGFNKLHNDAKEGGEIVGKTRKEIENSSGKKILTKNNFLNIKNKKKLK